MFKRDQHDQRQMSETMWLLRELYAGPALIDTAAEYARDAMNDAHQQAAPDDVEDATDDGR